jgi:predicted ATPase
MRRIVLTGGPGAGKTVITSAIVRARPDRFILVPEAATQVYGRLQTRWDRLDLEGRRDVQRKIYHQQIEQEERVEREHADRILLLDRGTIDGAAYWPDGPADYWKDLGTTLDAQLARYNAVIWMETAATLGIYDGEASNACRFEDPEGAIASGKLLLNLWGGHPKLTNVGAFSTLEDKIQSVMGVIDLLMQRTDHK